MHNPTTFRVAYCLHCRTLGTATITSDVGLPLLGPVRDQSTAGVDAILAGPWDKSVVSGSWAYYLAFSEMNRPSGLVTTIGMLAARLARIAARGYPNVRPGLAVHIGTMTSRDCLVCNARAAENVRMLESVFTGSPALHDSDIEDFDAAVADAGSVRVAMSEVTRRVAAAAAETIRAHFAANRLGAATHAVFSYRVASHEGLDLKGDVGPSLEDRLATYIFEHSYWLKTRQGITTFELRVGWPFTGQVDWRSPDYVWIAASGHYAGFSNGKVNTD